MSNNKDFKVKSGIQPTSYFEGVGTVVSAVEGYILSAASYDSVSFSVASQDNIPTGLVFNTAGTKLYMGGTQNETIYQYTLSTAFDLGTASYDSVSFSVSGQESNLQGFIFSADGAKLFVVGAGNDTVYQYTLSTAFDLSTASYDSVSFSVAGQDTNPYDVIFNDDGTKMYIAGNGTDAVYQYSLSTGFDLSTASYNSVSFSVSGQDATPVGIRYNANGTKLFMIGATNDSIYQYSLSTAFDLTTASYDSVSFSVASQGTAPQGMTLSADGTKMYFVDAIGDAVFQYSTALNTATLDLSTGSVFEVTPTSDIQVTLSNPAASGTVSGATLLLDGGPGVTYDISNAVYDSKSFSVSSENVQPNGVAFSNSGTKMFIAGGSAPDTIFQYSLSSAWDVSTSSYDSVSLDVSGQTGTGLNDLTFNNDGTKMYVCSSTPDVVYQYSLTTPFDLSTASYDSVSASVSEAAAPQALCFSSDGLKLLVLDTGSNRVEPYTLTTSFDISSVSYDGDFLGVGAQDNNVHGIAINEDGTKVFVLGRENDRVYEYTLTTPNDVTTGTYSGNSFSVASEEANVSGLFFGRNATKMYVSGNTNDSVFQYTVGSEATITYDTAIEWPSGTAPTSPAIGETDVVTFNTRDGGSTYQGVLAIDGAK